VLAETRVFARVRVDKPKYASFGDFVTGGRTGACDFFTAVAGNTTVVSRNSHLLFSKNRLRGSEKTVLFGSVRYTGAAFCTVLVDSQAVCFFSCLVLFA